MKYSIVLETFSTFSLKDKIISIIQKDVDNGTGVLCFDKVFS